MTHKTARAFQTHEMSKTPLPITVFSAVYYIAPLKSPLSLLSTDAAFPIYTRGEGGLPCKIICPFLESRQLTSSVQEPPHVYYCCGAMWVLPLTGRYIVYYIPRVNPLGAKCLSWIHCTFLSWVRCTFLSWVHCTF